MRVLIVTTQVPFVRGGAEILAEGLLKALCHSGQEAEIVSIPFKWYPPEQILDHMLLCRLMDLSESCGQTIDQVIGLKFPAYLVQHSNKVMWLLHQHRAAYNLWNTKHSDLIYSANGLQVRDAIINADNKAFSECSSIFTISKEVTKRLRYFNDVDSIPLYHPPRNADNFYFQEAEGYFFFPSRLCTIKRQHLVIKALAKTNNPVKVFFAGKADENSYMGVLTNLAKELKVSARAVFLDGVSEEHKLEYYSKALAVIYPPFDEDYGYVTLEAMLASKPIVTCQDAGGPLEFIRHRQTGLVVEPTPEMLAGAMDELWENRQWAKELGKAGREYYDSLNITWSNVVEKLLA